MYTKCDAYCNEFTHIRVKANDEVVWGYLTSRTVRVFRALNNRNKHDYIIRIAIHTLNTKRRIEFVYKFSRNAFR